MIRFGIASDDSSELWLSKDTDWRNSRLLCNVGSRDEPSWTSQNDWFNSFPSQVSNEVYLQQGHKYYIEIMHLQLGWGNFLRVAWKKPGITDFEVIDGNSTSLYQYEIHSESYVDYRRGMVHTGPACNATHSPKIRPHSFMKSQIHQYVLHESVKQTLPYCEYNASYTSLRAGGRDWEFISPPIRHDTYVFPYLEFSSDVVYIDKYPATPLPKEEAEGIVLEYMKKLKSTINPRYIQNEPIFTDLLWGQLHVALLKSHNVAQSHLKSDNIAMIFRPIFLNRLKSPLGSSVGLFTNIQFHSPPSGLRGSIMCS